MEKLLCPSMMCANYANLQQEIEQLESAGIDVFHMDVMDGRFVPTFGMGLQDVELICKVASKPADVHLMIEEPGNYVEMFARMGVEIIYIHPETDKNPVKVLQRIRDCGKKAGIAVSPGTAVATIEPLLSLVDYIMVMTVHPGFAGQKYLDFVDGKIDSLLKLKGKYHYEILIDGACSPQRIQAWSSKGVKGFVLGTSALFGKERTYNQIVPELRAL